MTILDKNMVFKTATVTALTGAALLLNACGTSQAAEIQDCERRLVNGFAAPSTYKRIKVESNDLSKVGPKHQAVTIEYDIANDQGVPIRETAMCRYLFEDDTKTVDLTSVARVYPGKDVSFEGRMATMMSLPKDQQEPLLIELANTRKTARDVAAQQEALEKLNKDRAAQ